jgi:hypothetical protein
VQPLNRAGRDKTGPFRTSTRLQQRTAFHRSSMHQCRCVAMHLSLSSSFSVYLRCQQPTTHHHASLARGRQIHGRGPARMGSSEHTTKTGPAEGGHEPDTEMGKVYELCLNRPGLFLSSTLVLITSHAHIHLMFGRMQVKCRFKSQISQIRYR